MAKTSGATDGSSHENPEIGSKTVTSATRLHEEHAMEGPHTAISVMVTCMERVEYRMVELCKYLDAQECADKHKPLFEWVKYEDYTAISDAVESLEEAMESLQSVVNQNNIEASFSLSNLSKARRISISVSNIAVFAMGVMNKRTAAYVEGHSSWLSLLTDDNAKHVVTSELANVLRYSTSATNSVWSAMDSLAKLVEPQPITPPARGVKSSLKTKLRNGIRDWPQSLSLILLIAILALLATSFVNPPDHLQQACARSNDLHRIVADGNANLYNLLKAQGEQFELNKLVFDHKIDSIRNQTILVAEQAQANGVRIDNIWEALGPPNADGTYYMSGSAIDVEKQLRDMNKRVEERVQQLKKDIALTRKEWLRADVRLTARLDRVERRVG